MFSSVIIHVICGYSASHLPWCSLVVDEMGSPGCSGDLPVSTPPFQGLHRLMYVIMLSFYVRVGMKQVLLCA